MLPLEERPQVLVCFDSPEPHTRVLWGTQYINPYFAQTTPEGGKVLAFEQEVQTGHLPANSDMDPYWIELEEREVTGEADTEAALTLLPPGTNRLPNNTPNPERAQITLVSIAPL